MYLILVTGIIKDLNTHAWAWKVLITIIIIIYCKEEFKLGIGETSLGQRHKIQIKYTILYYLYFMLLLIMYILFRIGIVYTDITIYKCLQNNLSLYRFILLLH